MVHWWILGAGFSNRHGRPRRMLTMDIRRTPIGLWARLRDSHKSGPHFPLPKIRTIGDELTLSLTKNLHFSFLPSHFSSLPSRRGHHCGAETRNEFTLSIAKKFFALFVPPLSNGTSRATSDRKPKTNDQILPSPIMFFPTKKWIKLIPKTIGNRKRDCAWGGSGW